MCVYLRDLSVAVWKSVKHGSTLSWNICNIKPVWNDHTNCWKLFVLFWKMQLSSISVQHQQSLFQINFYARLRNVTLQLSLVLDISFTLSTMAVTSGICLSSSLLLWWLVTQGQFCWENENKFNQCATSTVVIANKLLCPVEKRHISAVSCLRYQFHSFNNTS